MEHRRTRRFRLHLPLSVTRSGADHTPLAGQTTNISSSGVLFTTDQEPDLTSPVEYVIALNQDCQQPVNLRCIGKVIRAERLGAGADPVPAFQVAVTLERYEFVREQ